MPLFRLSILVPAAFLLLCCGKKQSAPPEDPPIIAPALRENQLGNVPSTFLRTAEGSPVHWQRWNPNILEMARDAKRPIFVLIGSACYPRTFETMQIIDDRPAIVRRLNQDFVPVLVDLDICRETSLLASLMSAEVGDSVGFPFFLILSHEGSPVTWQSVPASNDEHISDFFESSLEVVARLWNEAPDYVVNDSARKVEMRRERLPEPDPEVDDPQERQDRYRAAIRRLVGLYDEGNQSIMGAGGVFPFDLLDALALAAAAPSQPAVQQKRAMAALEGMLESIVNSAMVDLLDGGVYFASRGNSWNFPSSLRNATSQAQTARVLCRISQLHGKEGLVQTAVNAIDFAESHYQTADGLFCLVGKPGKTADLDWLWKVEELEDLLDDDEFAFWNEFSKFRSMGNLPADAALTGELFRLNSLHRAVPLEVAAQRIGISAAEGTALFESGRKKLLKARNARFPAPPADSTASALASFRMVSAYATLFTATGDEAYFDKALELGQKCRSSFASTRFLNERSTEEQEEMSDGRAFTYTVAAQAALDLGAITIDDEWNLWARDLITLLGEHFIVDGPRLIETREPSRVIDLTVEDRVMIFGESTAGMVRIALGRLKALGYQIPPALRPWLNSLPSLEDFPIVHTDVLRALALESSRVTILLGPDVAAEVKSFVAQLPLESYERRSSEALGNRIEIRESDGSQRTCESLDDLRALVERQK